MPRILFVHQVSTIGGASYCMLAILRGIDRKRFEPIVMLKEEGPLAQEIRELDIDVIIMTSMSNIPYNKSLFAYSSLMSYWHSERTQKEFAKILTDLHIDIVYLNNMMLYPYLKIAKKMGCKTIMHVREHWPNNEHQHQMKRARKYAEDYADKMIAINKYSASMFSNCKGKTTIIYDWFDIDNRYEPIPLEEVLGEDIDNLKVLLFTGGIGRIKGTHEILKTFIEDVHGDEYRLLMMGAGIDYKLNFDGLLGKIKKVLMLTGWKPYGYRMVKAIQSDNRIVVLPSTYNMVDIYRQAYCTVSYFTIPHANLALAEAISLGTVAVAAKTEESIEYSDNGRGAVLFKLNDRKDFVRKLKYTFDNYDKLKKNVLEHSRAIKQKFDPYCNIKKLNKVCEEVANNV